MHTFQIKHIPSDFRVAEALILPINYNNTHPDNNYYYYVLAKSGYTTFDAIAKLKLFFNVHQYAIGYAGLKDEDGITEQFISISEKLSQESIQEFNRQYDNHNQDSKFIRLFFYRAGNAPLQIGELCGNNFRVVIRKLPELFVKKLEEQQKFPTFFINYYGTQRFGLPGAEKNTHLIGEQLVVKNYEGALLLLAKQPSDIGRKAKCYVGDAQNFFSQIDQRQLAFYQASFYSYLWNDEVKRKIMETIRENYVQEIVDGITYLYPDEISGLQNIIVGESSIVQTKIVFHNNQIKKSRVSRQIFCQMNIACRSVFQDHYNEGYDACEVDFFLPSGSYATVAIPQFLRNFCMENHITSENLRDS